MCNRQRMVRTKVIGIEGTQSNCSVSTFDSKLGLAFPREANGAQAERKDIGIAKFQRPIKDFERSNSVMFVQRNDMCRDRQSGSVIAAMRNRRARMLNSGDAIFIP